MRGQPQLGLRRFMATTASMRSFFGPFGPGRRLRSGENSMRYFRFLSRLWTCSRVEDFRRGAQIRRTLAAATKDSHLMFDEHGLGNDGTDASGPCQPHERDDQMNEKND